MTLHSSRYPHWAVGVLVCVALFRLLYINHLELVGDEAYYWLWAQHPDICYLDKGPVIAWFIALGTALFGQTVFGIRFFAVILAAGTGLCLFQLARTLFTDRVALVAVVVAAITPLFAVGSILMTIDTIYIFFWAAAALTFWWAIGQDRILPWLITGALIGLSLLGKYTGAFELISFALFCFVHKPSRRHFVSRRFFAMFLPVAIALVPVFLWNQAHGWPTSHYLVHRGDLDSHARFSVKDVLTFVGGQAGVISPILFVLILIACIRPKIALQGHEKGPECIYLATLFWPLFGFYLILSFQHASEANWPAAAYFGGLILVAAHLDRLFESPNSWKRALAIGAVILAFLETAVLHETWWLNLPPRIDLLNRARGWEDLASKVEALQKNTQTQFIVSNKYMTASLLSFYLPGHPQVFMPYTYPPLNQLSMWPTYREKFPDGDGLFLSDVDRVASAIKKDFAAIKPVGTIQTESSGRKIDRYYLFVCRRAPSAVQDPKPQ
jgi:4-amino-4-deoxy-L-arabinose transferase-like glycosyltransferase